MSTEERKKVEVVAAVIVALIAVVTALGTFVVLPYRMSAAEAAITKTREQREIDHDLLTKIDARTEEMQRALVRLERRP